MTKWRLYAAIFTIFVLLLLLRWKHQLCDMESASPAGRDKYLICRAIPFLLNGCAHQADETMIHVHGQAPWYQDIP